MDVFLLIEYDERNVVRKQNVVVGMVIGMEGLDDDFSDCLLIEVVSLEFLSVVYKFFVKLYKTLYIIVTSVKQ